MSKDSLPPEILTPLRWPLLLTRSGMAAETVTRAFWPMWSVLFLGLGALMLGLQDVVSEGAVITAGVVLGVALLATLVRGIRHLRWPTQDAALARLDATMPGRPILTALDQPAIGTQDPASLAVWHAHQARMRQRLAFARAVEPDLRVARADPFALRYVALVTLCVGVIFGSLLRVGSVTAMGGTGIGLTSGPTWEGWVEPPGYTRLPSLYLNDITAAGMEVAEGSRITLRMYGEVGALSVTETVSGQPLPNEEVAQQTAREFDVRQSGTLQIDGPGGRMWDIALRPDSAPAVTREGEIEVTFEGQATIPFTATDDYGVVAGTARIVLALDEVDRRYGLAIAPEDRAAIEVSLPMPIAGDRSEFTESLVDNFSEHPWANLPVILQMEVEDSAGQMGTSLTEVITLPGRRFFDPMAAAIIEQRRALLWNRDNAKEIVQVLKAVSYLPDDIFRSSVAYLRLRAIVRRTEVFARHGMTDEQQAELAQALWDLAITLEDGDLADALDRLQRAQERLEEAMRNGASDEEIAELMQELRQATDDYLRQLAQQAQRDQEQNPDGDMMDGMDRESIEMSQNDLQRMMDRIQELMEEGRMDEAMEALEQLRQLMENMQVTQGQGGGQPSPGQQAMNDLAETLRDQQELSDDAFRDLQDQFNPGQQGQQGQQGQPGQSQQGQGQGQGLGQGQQPGQSQQGQGQGQQPGQGQGQGQGSGSGEGQSLEDNLAERQRALRDELNRQRNNLPGAGTEPGESARQSLRRAEDAMEGAEGALREGDLAEAIDQQSEAMEALREGMRDLGEAMAQQQQEGQGQQGMAEGADPGQQRDPLGRSAGTNGQIGTDESLLQGEDVYRRARELLDEIRRRSGDGERPEVELDYLERLLDRF